MIALRDELPLVRFHDGQVAVFERDWLVRRLVEAAEKAGYPQWWLAPHVAESLTTFLRQRFAGNVVAVPRLAQAVQSMLQVIGYAEVASHFDPGPPPIKISLLDLARKAGAGYELAFFDLLGRDMQQVLDTKATYFELFDLDRCVKRLRAKKIWSRDCESLRAEIITFLRERVGAAQHNMIFSVV
jgi:hypothetical protein